MAAWRAARHRAHRCCAPDAAINIKATPTALHQQVGGTKATVLPGLGGGGGRGGGEEEKETFRGDYGGAPIFSLLERTFARGERIWQRESLSLQGKRLVLS